MSGIFGIFHRNGTPIERTLLQSHVDSLAYRGPDSQTCWLQGSIGLGHAMLRTTHEARADNQPASLKGRFWMVADARIDCREDLGAELRRAGSEVQANAPASELILQAYATWGTACVEHLRGDFSFAIWDAAKRELFCARDHFGIKPFYYVQRGDLFLFSNTLNCLRMHPHVSGELNDAAIGDFLLFGLNYDNATTSFRDILRLPPAHCLSVSTNGLRIKGYWKPPTDGRIRYSNPEEYVERFHSLFQAAVEDRLRTDRIGILLSGGLDSSSVAAMAKEVSGRSAQATEIRGYTYVYESLIPHNDGEYAKEAGEFLHVPIQFIALDQTELFERWNDAELSWPEPVGNPFFASILDSHRIISTECRVILSGEGGDNLMDFQMWPYAKDLWRRGEWQRLLTEMANFLWIRPFPWRGIRARILRLGGKDSSRPEYPKWLAPEFERRLNLAVRWKEGCGLPKSPMRHPIHPRGYVSLFLPQWTVLFEQENAGVTHWPVETSYPFLDLRIVDYLLALPSFPWFLQKMLLREAMQGRLPERVRTRPKTPPQGDPVLAWLKSTGTEEFKKILLSADLDRYVDRSALIAPHIKMNYEQISSSLRPYCLSMWLHSARRIRDNIRLEAGNG